LRHPFSLVRSSSLYKRLAPSCLSAVAARLILVAGVAALSGGCSMSWQLGSLGKFKDKEEPKEVTGSVVPVAAYAQAGLADSDLMLARAAAVSVLERGSDASQKDLSQPWENPQTGARGMVTPLASAYTDGGFTCRDFLASHVQERSETWLQGEACRESGGKWQVRSLKQWKRA
jgi:surface antigen